MSMVITAEVTKPEDVEIALTVRMPLKGWREVIAGLGDESYSVNWHAARFRDDLREAVREVEHKALRVSREEKQP